MELCQTGYNLTFPIDHNRSKSTKFFLMRLLGIMASPPKFRYWSAALGDSAFVLAGDLKMVFPRPQSSQFLSFLFSV